MNKKSKIDDLRPWLVAGAGTLLLVVVGTLAPLSVNAQQCKDGICAHVAITWNGKKNVKTVSFTGHPRTKQDYVTDHYNVRGLPYPYPKQVEVWSKNNNFELDGTYTISVQSCRTKGALIRQTYCTSWVAFTIY